MPQVDQQGRLSNQLNLLCPVIYSIEHTCISPLSYMFSSISFLTNVEVQFAYLYTHCNYVINNIAH